MTKKEITRQVEEKLLQLEIEYKKIESPKDVFNCLENLTASQDAILISNPKEFNLTILQTNSESHFYLGFDDEIESNGVIPVNNSTGSNMLGLSASTIVIFKNLELANSFLKHWFDNSDSHFFNFGG